MGANQRDRYSWIAKKADSYVFTEEIDHIDAENNIYNHKEGTFEKHVPPLSTKSGDASSSVSHAKELFDAVHHALESAIRCNLLLVKGTSFGKTKGSIKSAIDGDFWIVDYLDGCAEDGFRFKLIRTA